MITVHHLNNARSQRVLWLLEELAVPYEIVRYQRDPVTMLAPASLRAVHPLGKAPVVTDEGRAVAESGAIIEHLVAKYDDGKLRPKEGSHERALYTYFLHYAEGSLMPLLFLRLVLAKITSSPMPFIARPVAKAIVAAHDKTFLDPQLKLHLDFLEGELGKRSWFAGEAFSAADVQMSFPLEGASVRGGLTRSSHPRVFGVLERMRGRPAYQRAIDKGGPFALA